MASDSGCLSSAVNAGKLKPVTANPQVDDDLIAVWTSMAEHYLDTETRHLVPRTGLACVNAELSEEEAQSIWVHEVATVVGSNQFSPTGRWEGWDQQELIEGLQKVRTARLAGGTWWRRLRNRILADRGTGRAIAACMRILAAVPESERACLSDDLCFLAGRYFDFGLDDQEKARKLNDRQLALYEEHMEEILRGLIVKSANESHPQCRSRVVNPGVENI